MPILKVFWISIINKLKIFYLPYRGGEAEHLASHLIQELGLQSPGAGKARLAILLGRSKFEDHKGVLQIFEEIKVNGGRLNTEAFNAIIKAKAAKEK